MTPAMTFLPLSPDDQPDPTDTGTTADDPRTRWVELTEADLDDYCYDCGQPIWGLVDGGLSPPEGHETCFE